MCAKYATPPWLALGSNVSKPKKNCNAAQIPITATAGKRRNSGKQPIGVTVSIVERGKVTMYAPMTPAIAPDAPISGTWLSRRHQRLGYSSGDAAQQIESHKRQVALKALDSGAEDHEKEHVEENVRIYRRAGTLR